jgi:hypothetical protein
MKSNNSILEIPLNLMFRESLLNANAELILQLQERLKAKCFRPQEGDGIKLAFMRIFIQALQAQNAIMKDTELDEFKKRLDALENSQGNPRIGLSPTSIFEGIE